MMSGAFCVMLTQMWCSLVWENMHGIMASSQLFVHLLVWIISNDPQTDQQADTCNSTEDPVSKRGAEASRSSITEGGGGWRLSWARQPSKP